MGLSADMQEARAWYRERTRSCPRAEELLNQWLLLLEVPRYARYLQVLRAMERGRIPSDAQVLLDCEGLEALPPATLFGQLLRRNRVCREDYWSLVGNAVAAAAAEDGDVHIAASEAVTLAHAMLLEGPNWPIARAPRRVPASYFSGLAAVRIPSSANIFTPLDGLIEGPGRVRFGPAFDRLRHMTGGALRILTAANACRAGRRIAQATDAVDAGLTFLHLFRDSRSLLR